jgi:hypothetical protein
MASRKEVELLSLAVQMRASMGVTDDNSDKLTKGFRSVLKKAFFQDTADEEPSKEDIEVSTQVLYDRIMQTEPEVKIDNNGTLMVTGLEGL